MIRNYESINSLFLLRTMRRMTQGRQSKTLRRRRKLRKRSSKSKIFRGLTFLNTHRNPRLWTQARWYRVGNWDVLYHRHDLHRGRREGETLQSSTSLTVWILCWLQFHLLIRHLTSISTVDHVESTLWIYDFALIALPSPWTLFMYSWIGRQQCHLILHWYCLPTHLLHV